MKTIAKIIYLFFVWLDQATGCYESYSGETAPYCGHSYDGHTGAFTRSHFHESDGGGETHGWFHRHILGVWYSNVDGEEYGFHLPVLIWCRWFSYAVKHHFRTLVVKIDRPYGKKTLYIKVTCHRPFINWVRGHGYDYRIILHVIRLKGIFPVSHNTI